MRSLIMRYLGHELRLTTNSAAVLEWADLSLPPFYELATEEASTDPVLRCEVLLGAGPSTMGVPTSAPIRTTIDWAREGSLWAVAGRPRVLFDHVNGIEYGSRPEDGLVYARYPRQDGLAIRDAVWLAQNVVASAAVDGQVAIPVHAAAVSTPIGCLAVVGTAGAGKSTLMLRLLELGADYVANDIVIVRPDGPVLRVAGLPLPCRLAPTTVRSTERLMALVRPYVDFDVLLTPQDELPTSTDNKLELLPAEVAGCYGRSVVAERELVGVLHLSRSASPPTLRPIDSAPSAELLLKNVLDQEPMWSSWTGLGFEGGKEWRNRVRPTVERLSAAPSIEINGSWDAGDVARAAMDWLEGMNPA